MATPFPELLRKLSDDLEAIADPATDQRVELEFGYSFTGHLSEDGGYAPLTSVEGTWYPTAAEALRAKNLDTVWRSELFLISRPKPQGAKRVDLPLGYGIS